MKIRIKTNALKKTIYKLIIVVPSVSHRPEFMGIKIDAQENTIIFQARNEKMDLQMAESDKNNFNTFENGSILIKARTINEIVGKMSGEWIELTKVDENLVIVKEFNNADSHDHISKYEINLLNIDGFGEISFTNTPIFEFNINSNDFKNVINNVSYAGNENSPRIILQGIEFKMEDNKIKATATDTMRIATTEIDFNIEKEDAVILPIKVMREVIKIIEQ